MGALVGLHGHPLRPVVKVLELVADGDGGVGHLLVDLPAGADRRLVGVELGDCKKQVFPSLLGLDSNKI